MAKIIEAKDVSLKYPDGTIALKNIDLHIKNGELVYIIGPSGSGKTSLLKLFMGMEFPTTGSMVVLGHSIDIEHKSQTRKTRMKIGPIFQEFKLIEGRTALENAILGMRFLDIPKNKLKESAMSALVKVGLAHKAYSLVDNLSWGERQRIAIARAVARKPILIIADEPTGNLDKDNAINILKLLTSFQDKNTTVIITTHATHMIDNEKEHKLIQMNNGTMSIERLGFTR